MSPSANKAAPRCHYEVLDVERDADEATIKKKYRKLALKYHPDKNPDDDDAIIQFRLVQQAYECLSDTVERKWYDEHREAILRGGGGMNAGDGLSTDNADISFLFDVMPYMYGGCYSGYTDDDDEDGDGFFAVYGMVFKEIVEGEKMGWKSEGNIDDLPTDWPTDFGTSTTDYIDGDLGTFYGTWESFHSALAFAWADEYDVREAPNRRVRRAMEDENRKKRRIAKKMRNDDVLALVRFVKKRDPRVASHKRRMEEEQKRREVEKKADAERKKVEAAAAREAWRMESERAMAETEESDRNAGKFRLADLSDDDDYHGGGGRKGKKNKNKNKRGKKKKKGKNKGQWDSSSDEEEVKEVSREDDEVGKGNCDENGTAEEGEGGPAEATDPQHLSEGNAETPALTEEEDQVDETKQSMSSVVGEEQNGTVGNDADAEGEEERNGTVGYDDIEESSSDEEETSEEEDEPDIWRCECCRKDFKTENQMENHMKSKKHREAWKKYEKKMKQKAKEEAMEDLLNDVT